MSDDEIDSVEMFHQYVFNEVLRVEKDNLVFDPNESPLQYYIGACTILIAAIVPTKLKEVKTIYPQGKEPAYELFSSSRRSAVVLKTVKQQAVIIMGLEHPTFRLRGGGVTT